MSDKLFFDDIRLAPGGDVNDGGEWHVARKVDDALRILQEHKDAGTPIRYASLDHDMGMSYDFPSEWTERDGALVCPNGCDLVTEMWRRELWPDEIFVHSANPWGRQNMRLFVAQCNEVPEHTVPYTELGKGSRQAMYEDMWNEIHDWGNSGVLGCDQSYTPLSYELWQEQMDKQMKIWEERSREVDAA